MSRVFDFALIYEVKNRELDNVLLLKCELEKRGYTATLIETWDQEFHRSLAIKAKVAVCYALYNDETISFVNQYLDGCRKFVNLQWEQVRTNGTEQADPNAKISSGIYGLAKKAVHICWGNNNFRKLTEKYGVSKNHAFVTGSITLDFLREEFKEFYLSRNELFSKYGINPLKKTYLFISSFSYIDLPKTILNSSLYQNQGFDVKVHYDISKKSRDNILDWFETELVNHPEITIIYRPHPAEASAFRLKQMCKQYSNFLVIDDLSIKQWILAVDKIYTWWSTSIAEVLAANKGCTILRPVSIPYGNELTVYNGANVINTFEEFDSKFCTPSEFPLSKDNFEDIYFIDKNEPSYKKVCDVLERVIKDDSYKIDELVDQNLKMPQVFIFNTKSTIKKNVFTNKKLYSFIEKLTGKREIKNGKMIQDLKNEYMYLLEMRNKNISTREDIENKEKKLIRILEASRNKK